MKNKVSPELEVQALKIARSRQREGQTKEQTKLIAQGIQKGVAEYKKQQNIKLRAIDKQRKQTSKQRDNDNSQTVVEEAQYAPTNYLPWILLALSWMGFAAYIVWATN